MWSFVSTWYFSKQAAQAGKTVLESGGDAMDAVIKGINRVESDPEVESVGKGGFLNENGELALDAAVMDGNTMKTGAVCAVRGFENPINIARAVMENTKHNILIGAGAESFARNMGIKESDMESLITDHARDVLKKSRGEGSRYHRRDSAGQLWQNGGGNLHLGCEHEADGQSRRFSPYRQRLLCGIGRGRRCGNGARRGHNAHLLLVSLR